MKAGSILKRARTIFGISQRELADRAGVAQPVIARIEAGRASPRADTLDRLLAACGFDLTLTPRAGRSVDRAALRKFAVMTPAERLRSAVREAALLRALHDARVRFIVIGGTAAHVWGSPEPGNDLDICYARDDQNLRRLAMVLQKLRARFRGVNADVKLDLDERALAIGERFDLVTDAGNLSLFGSAFDQLFRTAAKIDLDGMQVRVAALDDLIEMKRVSRTLEDRHDLELLGALADLIQ